MRSLIVSDILRILKKKTYWIVMAIVLVITLFSGLGMIKSGFNGMTSQSTNIRNTGSTILGICIFLSVYADEFSSRSMQCMIGRGISRAKLQTAKLIDCVILTFISCVIWAAWVTVLNLIFGAKLQPSYLPAIYAAFLAFAFQAIAYGTISAVFLYKSSNVAAATVVDIVLYVVLFEFIDMIATNAPLAPTIIADRICLTGCINQIYTRIVLGQPCGWLIAGVCLFYISGALLISILVFRKRELDF